MSDPHPRTAHFTICLLINVPAEPRFETRQKEFVLIKARKSPSGVEHLAGIEQVRGIERRLDPAHEVKRDRAVLLVHIGALFLADAVLAGAGAAHCDGAMGETGSEAFSR